MTEAHGIRVRRLRLVGIGRNYDIDFTTEGRVQDLSVISGAFSSGKTAVLEFVAYGLGAKNHPRHPEVLRKVRSALLEVELSGDSHIIERAVGEPSTVAFVRRGRLDQPSFSTIEKKVIAPAGAPPKPVLSAAEPLQAGRRRAAGSANRRRITHRPAQHPRPDVADLPAQRTGR